MTWKKFGSPYDPNYIGTGKVQRPQEQAEREAHRLRGCFDPECPMCNPDANGKGLPRVGGGAVTPVRSVRPGESMRIDFLDMGSQWEKITDAYFRAEGEAASAQQTPARPPASYREARKAVEKWLTKAPEQAFDDIIGNDAALVQLRDAIQAPVKHKVLYEAYGMKMPKGAMLSGPPGCGKTMFARAAGSEMRRLYGSEVEFISISGSELQSPFIGVTEGYIKAIFTFAREYKAFHGHPLLVFMDEADVLLPDRTGRVRRVASWEESQVATFLAEMDGILESGAFVLLATNRPEVIDQAVLRDGRCDFKITVARPTMEAVEHILRNNFAGVLLGDDAGADELVFAAAESLFDPHRVLKEGHLIKVEIGMTDGQASHPDVKVTDKGLRHFLFEHIISGAMAASVPARAKRHAFARDKATGVAKGVTVADVLAAVNDLFEENKGLDHSFALNEFKAEMMRDAQADART